MTNSIRTISMPAGSDADRVLTEWANDGKNVSEMTRKAVESFVRTDALQRKVLALEWVVAQRGVCPVLLEPPEHRYDAHHQCDLCADRISIFGGKNAHELTAEERRWVLWRQEALGSLVDMWRGY